MINRHKDMKEEEMNKIVLICKNCGHQDLLKNFLKKKQQRWEKIRESPNDRVPAPYHPYPKPDWGTPRKPYYGDPYKRNITCLVMINDYEEMFFCPKCGSSLVCLNPKFVKNNTARTL